MILALVDDLLFSSKIRAAAGHAGCDVAFVRRPGTIDAEARQVRPSLVIIDLDRAPLDPVGAIRVIKTADDLKDVPVVAFASHVHADLMQAARLAGADLTLARSAFVARLPALMAAPPSGLTPST